MFGDAAFCSIVPHQVDGRRLHSQSRTSRSGRKYMKSTVTLYCNACCYAHYSSCLYTTYATVATSHIDRRPFSPSQIKLEHSQTVPWHIPLEAAILSVSRRSTGDVQRLRHNLGLVVDVVVRVEVSTSENCTVDGVVGLRDIDRQGDGSAECVDDLSCSELLLQHYV